MNHSINQTLNHEDIFFSQPKEQLSSFPHTHYLTNPVIPGLIYRKLKISQSNKMQHSKGFKRVQCGCEVGGVQTGGLTMGSLTNWAYPSSFRVWPKIRLSPSFGSSVRLRVTTSYCRNISCSSWGGRVLFSSVSAENVCLWSLCCCPVLNRLINPTPKKEQCLCWEVTV